MDEDEKDEEFEKDSEKKSEDELFMEPEEDLISEEEDRQLKEKYGVHVDYKDFRPNVTETDMQQMQIGRLTYEQLKGSQYSLKYSFYLEDRRNLKSKRRFEKDLEEAIGGKEALNELTEEYDEIMDNLLTPENISKK